MAYAEGTAVPVERSRAEIELLLRRYGATQFVSGWDADRALIGFAAQGRQLRFVLPGPDPKDKRFTHHRKRTTWGTAAPRTALQVAAVLEQETRRRWRALALVIKAKLEAVECGIATFEEEFMPWIVLPDGSTVGQYMAPQIERAYASGEMPKLLPGLPARGEAGQ